MIDYISEKLKVDEAVFAISVIDVQESANQILGRSLSYSEMYQVQKMIEWGMFDWFEIVKEAIVNLETK